jgi:hypothetical protein
MLAGLMHWAEANVVPFAGATSVYWPIDFVLFTGNSLVLRRSG